MAPPGYATTPKIVQVQIVGSQAGANYPAKRRPLFLGRFSVHDEFLNYSEGSVAN